ncbi:MAG: phosphoenolpyruvate carboxykinase (GTP) [Spirochaetes bacterium]|nr:phosphoenolpyruvate carboxykinase (GTP) [Spirochaetota bacterium]
MGDKVMDLLKSKLDKAHLKKLETINNKHVNEFLKKVITLCHPKDVYVCDGSDRDVKDIKDQSLAHGEERKLKWEGHTIHFDGYYDQARDKENTKFLVSENVNFDPNLNQTDRKKGLAELNEIFKGIMKDHTLYVLFFCLGPTDSRFSLPALQITDSTYVAHSEILLYRQGYEQFKKLKGSASADFFRFLHSEGELEGNVSKDIEKRRVYIDVEENIVYSVNTQYGGNTLGLKKLAMRLAINKGYREGWLTEHMFLMGVNGPGKRKGYFTGAFPSLCGKTSTSMLPGETIVGDDIAYLRIIKDKVHAVNVEKGMFGIIDGVNEKDDPILWKVLNRPYEVIFSNVLITEENLPFWKGKDPHIPEKGFNHSGQWYLGKTDSKDNEIPPAHKNARFTVSLDTLENVDENLDNPKGVEVAGIIYGGRDSDTSVPVEESFDWAHGIVTKGAALESETTAATLGKVGIRKFNPMSNLDFLSIPIGAYVEHNLKFGKKVSKPPRIYSVNYFLKDDQGNFLNSKTDKSIWIKWMAWRCHNDVKGIKTPTGIIPLYEDLKDLFKKVLDRNYTQDDYIKQFTVRIPENLAKIERVVNIYKKKVADAPQIIFKLLEEQKKRLLDAQNKMGDYISPLDLPPVDK